MSKSKEATKQSLKKVLSFILSRVQPFQFTIFFLFFLSYCLIFAENGVMKQNIWDPLIFWTDRAYIEGTS